MKPPSSRSKFPTKSIPTGKFTQSQTKPKASLISRDELEIMLLPNVTDELSTSLMELRRSLFGEFRARMRSVIPPKNHLIVDGLQH
jgi:hypothetical protein